MKRMLEIVFPLVVLICEVVSKALSYPFHVDDLICMHCMSENENITRPEEVTLPPLPTAVSWKEDLVDMEELVPGLVPAAGFSRRRWKRLFSRRWVRLDPSVGFAPPSPVHLEVLPMECRETIAAFWPAANLARASTKVIAWQSAWKECLTMRRSMFASLRHSASRLAAAGVPLSLRLQVQGWAVRLLEAMDQVVLLGDC